MRLAVARAAIRRGWCGRSGRPTPRPELEADLGQLGGLARAGLAADDDHLVVADRRGDLVPPLVDRQLGGKSGLGRASRRAISLAADSAIARRRASGSSSRLRGRFGSRRRSRRRRGDRPTGNVRAANGVTGLAGLTVLRRSHSECRSDSVAKDRARTTCRGRHREEPSTCRAAHRPPRHSGPCR